MKNIDDELKKMSIDTDADFDAYIEKAITLRIKKTAAKTCVTIIAAIVVIFFCISPLVSLCVPNAAKLNEGEYSTLLKTMRAYYETIFPYSEVFGIDVEKNGFGCYTLNMDVQDKRGPLHIPGPASVVMKMNFGKLSVKSDDKYLATFILGRFDRFNKDTDETLQELYGDIEELPKSAVVYASVSQKKAEDVSRIMEKSEGKVRLEWMQIHEPKSDFQAGIAMQVCAAYDGKRDYRDDMSAEEIKEVYIDNLKILKENFDIWKDLGLYSDSTVYNTVRRDILDTLISAAEKDDSFESRNYCISGKRDDILSYLKSSEFSKVSVDHVSYSALG